MAADSTNCIALTEDRATVWHRFFISACLISICVLLSACAKTTAQSSTTPLRVYTPYSGEQPSAASIAKPPNSMEYMAKEHAPVKDKAKLGKQFIILDRDGRYYTSLELMEALDAILPILSDISAYADPATSVIERLPADNFDPDSTDNSQYTSFSTGVAQFDTDCSSHYSDPFYSQFENFNPRSEICPNDNKKVIIIAMRPYFVWQRGEGREKILMSRQEDLEEYEKRFISSTVDSFAEKLAGAGFIDLGVGLTGNSFEGRPMPFQIRVLYKPGGPIAYLRYDDSISRRVPAMMGKPPYIESLHFELPEVRGR